MKDVEVELTLNNMEDQLQCQEPPGEISINVLSGNKSCSSIRLQEKIKGWKVSVLLDNGLTRTFIDSTILKSLGVLTETLAPLLVTMADDTKVLIDTISRGVNCTVQGYEF